MCYYQQMLTIFGRNMNRPEGRGHQQCHDEICQTEPYVWIRASVQLGILVVLGARNADPDDSTSLIELIQLNWRKIRLDALTWYCSLHQYKLGLFLS